MLYVGRLALKYGYISLEINFTVMNCKQGDSAIFFTFSSM
jgi:hypothetical protein